jgi:hypothetical protein
MGMELTIMLIMVFVPPAIFALIVSYLCDMSRTVFLGGFATGLTIIIASEMVSVEYLVFPILIMAYLIWTLAFGRGEPSE